MTDTPAPAPSATRRSSSSSKTTWHADDLVGRASRWNTTPAVVRAALKAAGKDAVASPEEAEALVRTFLGQDIPQLERDAAAKRAKGAK
jgi:hypothetical protein